ncbi:unnamed protein product [Alopecurus aequalis]
MASGSRRPHGSSSSSISRSSFSSISRSTSSALSRSRSSSTSSQWTMKLMVNNNSQHRRVVYAEAGKDVVDYLFRLLTLPIGQVFRLLRDSHINMVGSVGHLYRSVRELDDTYICHHDAKDALLRPMGGYESGNFPLLTDGSSSSSSSTNRSGYVHGRVTYMIMDNLKITPPSTISGITTLLNNSGIRDISALAEMTVQLGYKEGLQILKASLESETVLTDVFLGRTRRA